MVLCFMNTKVQGDFHICIIAPLRNLKTDFTSNNFLFGTVKLIKNAAPDKYKYSAYGIGFDSYSEFSFTDGIMGTNVIIFGTDMSLFVNIENENKDILIFVEGRAQGLDYNLLTLKTYQFKVKDSQIKDYEFR